MPGPRYRIALLNPESLRMVRIIAALTLVFCLLPGVAQPQPYPDHQSVYVNDFADTLDAKTKDKLLQELTAIRESHGIEMTVVTIDTIDTYDEAASWEAFATRMFNGWGIGNTKRDDGVMFLFAMQDRNMRLEVGAGYHEDWDQTAEDIVQSIMVPNFKSGNINGGVLAGVRTMIARIKNNITEGRSATDTPFGKKSVSVTAEGATITYSKAQEPESNFDWIWYALVVPVLGGGAYLFRRFLRRCPRYCQKCETRMALLDEVADDAHLDQGSQLEENIKSVDYDVWQCPSCAHAHIERWRNWFSRYGACPACGYRALESDSTTLRSATTSSTGLRRIDYNCVNCQHSYSETKTIPRRSKSSSSSSSSFSGGSSSGGGASGSW